MTRPPRPIPRRHPPPVAPTQTAPAAGSTDPTAPAAGSKTYTQEELDRIVNERVNRSKAQFKDYAKLKEKAGKSVELETSLNTLTGEKAQLESDFDPRQVMHAC